MINGPLKYKYARKRQKAFSLRWRKRELHPTKLHRSGTGIQLRRGGLHRHPAVEHAERPDAIFAASDVFAVAAIKAAKRLGISIRRILASSALTTPTSPSCPNPRLLRSSQPQYHAGVY